MLNKKLLIYILFLFSGSLFSQNISKLDLTKSFWFYKKVENYNLWDKATVPGTIHTDLLNGRLIEDPYFRDNEKKLQWIENQDYDYRTFFQVDQNLLSKNHIDLVFEGIDTYASIFLNGKPLFQADNMFRTWKINCKKFLILGRNEIVVKFSSSAKKAKQKYDALKAKLPNDERVMVRKAQYQFGWDWGPRFVTCGIWKNVFIEGWNELKILDVQINTSYIGKEKAFLLAVCNINSDKDQMVDLNVSFAVPLQIHLQKGMNKINQFIQIDYPKLWWCNGLGEPYLYEINLEISKERTILDKKKINYGIRDIKVIQEPDSFGKSFYFQLNGVPVFMKGANYIPTDNFVTRTDSAKYASIIDVAVESNMNMLRVWGGGIYENDVFYDLCDKKGILVWQDFMFACAMYPGDTSFIENVKQEAIDNVVRLRNHPCIALWCGNNEIDEGWKNWGWQKQFGYSALDSTRIWNDYKNIFQKTLPEVINQYDSSRFYWTSSPKIGWGHKESLTEGDSHYWGVWWGEEPFDIYKKKVGRFASEYGFQGMPDLKTIEKFTNPSDRNIDSAVMKLHQKHLIGYETIKKYMTKSYDIPKDFNQFVYISQILQAEGMKIAIEAHRRAKPYCMGTLYWQFNDCWPVVSWSGMDYYQNYKALQYFVKKAYKEVIFSVNKENDSLKVFAISDRLEKFACRLEVNLMNFKGRVISTAFVEKVINPNISIQLYCSKIKDIIKETEIDSLFLNVNLFENGKIIDSQNHFFAEPKEMKLPMPKIQISNSNDGNKKKITLISDVFAKSVYITCENSEGKFSENYVDLMPSVMKEIEFENKGKTALKDLKFKVISLNEIQNK